MLNYRPKRNWIQIEETEYINRGAENSCNLDVLAPLACPSCSAQMYVCFILGLGYVKTIYEPSAAT